MSSDRVSIHAGDPPEVFELEATFLAAYRHAISADVDDIVTKFPASLEQAAGATAYIARIGSEIPDSTIKAAVKKLAAAEFRQRGVDVPDTCR